MYADGLSSPPQILADGDLEGSGAHDPVFWLSAPAHWGATTAPAAAVAREVSDRRPASGSVDLAGGPRRVVPDARHRRTLATPTPHGAIAGVDLGEVQFAAVTTTCRHALVVSGRQRRACQRRACQRWRPQVHSLLHKQLSRCQPRSRRAPRPGEREALPPATGSAASGGAQGAGLLCARGGEPPRGGRWRWEMAVGDGRDIQPDVSLERVSHQKSSQWPHGLSVRGLWRAGCGARAVARGFTATSTAAPIAAPIAAPKAAYGRSSKLQADTIKHRRPIGGAPLTRARSSWR
jgi:hypothetical protein